MPPFHGAVIERLLAADNQQDGLVLISRMVRLECLVRPLREADTRLLDRYEEFFSRRRFVMIEIRAAIVDRATDLLARYGFKTPDAIHLATAIEERAGVFLTGDAALARCRELRVDVLTVP